MSAPRMSTGGRQRKQSCFTKLHLNQGPGRQKGGAESRAATAESQAISGPLQGDQNEYSKVATKIQSKWRAVRTERHVGLIRLIYTEARKTRQQKSDAPGEGDTGEETVRTMQKVRSEVCRDLLGAVRKCTRMYKTMVFMKKEAEKMAHIRCLRQKMKTVSKLHAAGEVQKSKARASDAAWADLFSLVSHFDELDDEKLYVCDKACRKVQKLWCNKRIGVLRLKLKVLNSMSHRDDAQEAEKAKCEEQLDAALDCQKRLAEFEAWAKSVEQFAELASTKAAAAAVTMVSGHEINVDEKGQASLAVVQEEAEEEDCADETAGEAVDDTSERKSFSETTDELGAAVVKALDSSPCVGGAEDTESAGKQDNSPNYNHSPKQEHSPKLSVIRKLSRCTSGGTSGGSDKADIEQSDDNRYGKFLRSWGSTDSLVELDSDVVTGASGTLQEEANRVNMSLDMQSPRRSSGIGSLAGRSGLGHLRSPRANDTETPSSVATAPKFEERKASVHKPVTGLTSRVSHVGREQHSVDTDLAVGASQVQATSHASQPRKTNPRSGQANLRTSLTGGFGVRKEKESSTDTAEFMPTVAGHGCTAAPLAHPTLREAPKSARVPRLEKIDHPSRPPTEQKEPSVSSARAPSSHGQMRRQPARFGSSTPQHPPGKLAPLPAMPALSTPTTKPGATAMPALSTPTTKPGATESGHRFSLEGEGAKGFQRQLVHQEQQKERNALPKAAPHRPNFNPCAISASNRQAAAPVVGTPRLGARGHGATAGNHDDSCLPMPKATAEPHSSVASAPRRVEKTRTAGRIIMEEKHNLLPPLETWGNGGGQSVVPSPSAAAAAMKTQPPSASSKHRPKLA